MVTLGTGAARLDINFQIGSYRLINFEFNTDISLWEFEFFVKKNKGDRLKVFSKTLASGISFPVYSDASIDLEILSTDSSIEEGQYYYELRRTDTDTPLISGYAYFDFDPKTSDEESVSLTITDENVTVTITNVSGASSSGSTDLPAYQVTTTTTLTPDVSAYGSFEITAQASALTIAAPTTTPDSFTRRIFRISSASSYLITYNSIYRAARNSMLMDRTIANDSIYFEAIYDAVDNKWDVFPMDYGLQRVYGPSEVFPNGLNHALRLNPYTAGTKPMEFFHTGKTVIPDSPYHNVVTGFGKHNWAIATTWNMRINTTSGLWEAPDPTLGQCAVEVAAEGITFHAVPAGQSYSQTWHEMFQIRHEGIEGGGTKGPTSGTYLHAKTTLYFRYESASPYTDDEHSWSGGFNRQADPFIHLHTCETKQTEDEALRLEANHNSIGGLQIHFKKSRGDYFAKTAVAIGTFAGFINFQVHDGVTYQNTARIYAETTAAASAGVAPQKIVFRTSATNAASAVNRLEVMPDGLIRIPSTGTLLVGGSTITNAFLVADFQSTTKAIAVPRMTKAQRDAMTASAGMVINQTDNTPGMRVYNGTNWVRFTETID